MIPHFGNLQVLELSFDIGMDREVPDNLAFIVSGLPSFSPRIESIDFTLAIQIRIPEKTWSPGEPWPLFDVGFLERRQLPRLRNVTCCLHRTMEYFHGNSRVSYDGFVTTMQEKLVGLVGSDILNFAERDSSYRWGHLP